MYQTCIHPDEAVADRSGWVPRTDPHLPAGLGHITVPRFTVGGLSCIPRQLVAGAWSAVTSLLQATVSRVSRVGCNKCLKLQSSPRSQQQPPAMESIARISTLLENGLFSNAMATPARPLMPRLQHGNSPSTLPRPPEARGAQPAPSTAPKSRSCLTVAMSVTCSTGCGA